MTLHFNLGQLRGAGGAPEYLEELCEAGTVTGNLLEIEREVALEIRSRHEPAALASRQQPPHPSVFPPSVLAPVPREKWPFWAVEFAERRAPGEIGVGDTVARLIGPAVSAAFKNWYRRLFHAECGCSERQRELNLKYPYD